MEKFLLVLAILLSTAFLSAQNPNIVSGYYISTAGDSILGQIDLSKTSGADLRFKAAGEKKWRDLDAREVARAGGDKGLSIIPREIRIEQDTERVFVQKVIGGGYNLYQGKAAKSGAVYYINSKGNETFVRLNKLGYDTQLKTMLAPCSQHVQSQKVRYTSNALQQYIAEINRCAFPGEQPYTYHRPLRSRFGIGLNAFYYTIQPVVTKSDISYGTYKRINKPGVGLSFRYDIIPAFSFHTGIRYIDKTMHSDSLVERVEFTVNKPGMPPYQAYDYYRVSRELNFKYLEVPLGITYTMLPYRNWSPFLGFGLTIQKSVTNNIVNDYGDPICEPCTDPGPSDLYSVEELPRSRSSLANFFGEMGVRRQLGAHHHLEINLAYYRQREITSYRIGSDLFPSSVIYYMRTNRLQAGLAYYYFFGKKS